LCKCRSLANHVLGNLRIYRLSLEGPQRLTNKDLNLFTLPRVLAVRRFERACTPLVRLHAFVSATPKGKGLRWKHSDDPEDVYPEMHLIAPCIRRGVTVSGLGCERKSRWNITLSKERRSLRSAWGPGD
jgi:hypothetical protein